MRTKKVKYLLIALVCNTLMQNDALTLDINDIELMDVPTFEIKEQKPIDEFAPIVLDLSDYTYINKENKKFKLKVQKEEKPAIVESKNQVWDDSKLFKNLYYSDERNIRNLPSYGSLGTSLKTKLDEKTSIRIGQDGLDELDGNLINFSYANWSMYRSGGIIESSTEKLTYAVSTSTETDTNYNQVAALVSTKPKKIFNTKATMSVGAGVFSNLMNSVNKNTAGVFTQYNWGRFSLGTQLSQSSYTNNGGSSLNTVHILPKLEVNEHLTLKTKLVKDMEIDQLQGEIGLSLKPLKKTDVWSIDVSAANFQTQNAITRQRIKFSTEFKF